MRTCPVLLAAVGCCLGCDGGGPPTPEPLTFVVVVSAGEFPHIDSLGISPPPTDSVESPGDLWPSFSRATETELEFGVFQVDPDSPPSVVAAGVEESRTVVIDAVLPHGGTVRVEDAAGNRLALFKWEPGEHSATVAVDEPSERPDPADAASGAGEGSAP